MLDVGCGEGVLTYQWAQQLGDGAVVGIDLDDAKLQAEWETRRRPNLEYLTMTAENLPFADGEFDLATAIEVLEHVPDPAHTVAEMARVRAAAPARVGPARAAVADAEHGPRRVPAGPGQHAGPPEPLVQALVRAAARPPRRGRRGALAVPWTMLLVRLADSWRPT